MASERGVLAALQTILSAGSVEEPFLLNELGRRLVLNGLTLDGSGILTFGGGASGTIVGGVKICGHYTPGLPGTAPNFLFMATGGGTTDVVADNLGTRRELMHFYLTKADDIDACAISIDSILTSNPGAGVITRTGIHIKQYCLPDNGGETSCLLADSTGAGNALTAYKLYKLRPSGFHDYSGEASGYCFEGGTDGGNYAVIIQTGVGGAPFLDGGAVEAALGTPGSKGFVVYPIDTLFDTRIAYACGVPQLNSPDLSRTFYVQLNGTIWTKNLLDLSDPAAGQIAFPASQHASANANTLDDYEEGTFVPTIGGSTSESGQAYSLQTGVYTKIGRHVHIQGQVTLSTLGTITGSVRLKGLPFPAAGRSTLQVGFWGAFTTNFIAVQGYIESAAAIAQFTGRVSAGPSVANLVQGDLSNTSDFIFSADYDT